MENYQINFYYNKEWEHAIEKFCKSINLEKNNKLNPSKIFLQRSKQFKKNPPDNNWKGEYILTEK